MTSETQTPAGQPGNFNATLENKQAVASRLRRTIVLAGRVQVQADGTRRIIRFNQVEILEHWVLLISFLVLALTGLLLFAARLEPVAWFINNVLGGASTVRGIHQVAGVVFIVLSVFHAVRILTIWIVKRESGSMLPRIQDGRDFMATLRYNLGKSEERPVNDRFTIEEKLSYWALVVFALVMILSGLVLWFPTVATWVLPGAVIPLARTVHSMTAILAILAVLTWHLYFTVIQQRYPSIFTGKMTEREMQENHPLEYQRILKAYEEIHNLSKGL